MGHDPRPRPVRSNPYKAERQSALAPRVRFPCDQGRDRRGGAGTWRIAPPRVRRANAHQTFQTASNRQGKAHIKKTCRDSPFTGGMGLRDPFFFKLKLRARLSVWRRCQAWKRRSRGSNSRLPRQGPQLQRGARDILVTFQSNHGVDLRTAGNCWGCQIGWCPWLNECRCAPTHHTQSR